MASSFASQLQAIAAKSTHELDLRARRNAHAESLLFERSVAAKQDFDSIYAICLEGYQELCYLDPRFRDFERSLFSAQAKDQDRDQMTQKENEALDNILGRFMRLLGSKMVLKPALKTLEWLVRRFRVHVYNVDPLLQTLLPYHEQKIWANVLSIIPTEKIVGTWKLLRPYLKTTWNVPRHAVAYTMANNDAFFVSTNSYVLQTCREQSEYPLQMRFWGALLIEAVTTRLSQAKAGRKEVHKQRLDDALLKIMSLLNDSLQISTSEELRLISYTITMVLAANAELSQDTLNSLSKALADTTATPSQVDASLLTALAVVCSAMPEPRVPRSLLDALVKSSEWQKLLVAIADTCPVQALVWGLVNALLAALKQKNSSTLLPFLDQLIRLPAEKSLPVSLVILVRPVLRKVVELSSSNLADDPLRLALIELLRSLTLSSDIASALSQAVAQENQDPSMIENLLMSTLPQLAILPAPSEDVMELDEPITQDSDLGSMMAAVRSGKEVKLSFLSSAISEEYEQLVTAFKVACKSEANLSIFTEASTWGKKGAFSLSLVTFLLAASCDSYLSTYERVFATQLLAGDAQTVSSSQQLILPYAVLLLNDENATIRRSATTLLTAIRAASAAKSAQPHTMKTVYGSIETQDVSVAAEVPATFIETILEPAFEECALDAQYIVKLLHDFFSGSLQTDSKKSLRQVVFELFRAHALATQTISLKAFIVTACQEVPKIGQRNKTKELLPLLTSWMGVSQSEANQIARSQNVTLSQFDSRLTSVIDTWDREAIDVLAKMVPNLPELRMQLLSALYEHLQQTWSACKEDVKVELSRILYDQALVNEPLAVAQSAQSVLSTVPVPTEALYYIMDQSIQAFGDIPQSATPNKKRRRSSTAHEGSKAVMAKAMDSTIAKVTLALEAVQANEPEEKPELLGPLFDILSALTQLVRTHKLDLPYLYQSCLSSMVAITERAHAIDTSVVKSELVIECLRSADHPQVQSSALLLAAALARVAPDRLIHNIMPIFTFMDQGIFLRDDEHSVNTINHAIDMIIPAMIESLRKSKQPQAFLSAMASTISSLTSAIDHVPSHRRITFLQRLLARFGADELGYIVLAMLSLKKRTDPAFNNIVIDVVSDTPVQSVMLMYGRLIGLARDVMATPSPPTVNAMFGFDSKTKQPDKHAHVQAALSAALAILDSKILKSSMQKLHKVDAAVAESLRKALDKSFADTLEVVESSKSFSPKARALAAQCLEGLLALPSLAELLQALPTAIAKMDEDLKARALRVLGLQIQSGTDRKTRTQMQATDFLKRLQESLPSIDQSSNLLQATLLCMDQLVEKFGRKDNETVVAVGFSIIELDLTQSQKSEKLQTTMLLNLASIIELLKEASVPLVPALMPQLQAVFKSALGEQTRTESSVVNATLATLTAIFSHVPYMVSNEQLVDILAALFQFQAHFDAPIVVGNADELLQLVARKVDFDVLVQALATISESTNNDKALLGSVVATLSSSVDAATKSTITRHSNDVSAFFLLHLQKEADASPDADGSAEVELTSGVTDSTTMTRLKELCIKFVYKLNDTTFRPIFESWVDWGVTSSTSFNSTARQITLFTLFTHFFATLKGLVTTYISSLLKPISNILATTTQILLSRKNKPEPATVNYLMTTLSLLHTTLTHSQQSTIFTSPSTIALLLPPLVNLLTLAPLKPIRHPALTSHLRTSIIPTLTSFTNATLDAPSAHTSLATSLAAFRKHFSSHVRLASIQTLRALCDDEDCGDEFVANTIGGGVGEGSGATGGSFGELMIYVNEMLEDDSEEVEMEVRRWVQSVRQKVGEDVFEA